MSISMFMTSRERDQPNGIRQPTRSKKAPTAGVRMIGITPWRDELYPAASLEVPRVCVWMSARFEEKTPTTAF